MVSQASSPNKWPCQSGDLVETNSQGNARILFQEFVLFLVHFQLSETFTERTESWDFIKLTEEIVCGDLGLFIKVDLVKVEVWYHLVLVTFTITCW